MSEESEDKQFEPTPKKLEDLRKKGDIPRSADLTTAAAFGGFAIVGLSVGADLLIQLGTVLANIFIKSPELATEVFSGGQPAITGTILTVAAGLVAPWFVVPIICVIAMVIVQKSFTVAPSKLAPKLNRVSLLANAKNKFGRRGIFEFFKSFMKLIIFTLALGIFLARLMPKIMATIFLGPIQIVGLTMEVSLSFIAIVLLIVSVIGGIDYFWQNAEHLRKNRMSHKELTDEAKQMEGDPHIKQQRRQKAQEVAANQMLSDVPSADVVIVNPEHFAVALKWSREPGSAPVCVAKGKGEIAARIREIANENAVPIHRDPPTARALFATVSLGQQIKPDYFKAVAAAIRFSEEMRRKMSM